MLDFERRWASAVMEGFAPPGGPGFSPLAGEVDYVHAAEVMMRSSTHLAAFGLRAALWVAALAPLWLFGRFVSIDRLTGSERSQVLLRLLAHPFYMVRELSMYLKLATCMALFAAQGARAKSGYDRGRRQLAVLGRPGPKAALGGGVS